MPGHVIAAAARDGDEGDARTEAAMRLGMVGLGKMGGNMVTRLLRGGHEVVVYDLDRS